MILDCSWAFLAERFETLTSDSVHCDPRLHEPDRAMPPRRARRGRNGRDAASYRANLEFIVNFLLLLLEMLAELLGRNRARPSASAGLPSRGGGGGPGPGGGGGGASLGPAAGGDRDSLIHRRFPPSVN